MSGKKSHEINESLSIYQYPEGGTPPFLIKRDGIPFQPAQTSRAPEKPTG